MALITLGKKALPTGSIIQVTDQVVINTSQTLSTDTYTDLTSAIINITPNSTSSKIILNANINVKYDNANVSAYGIKFSRNGANIFTTSTDYASYVQSDNDRLMQFWNYIDAPSSTSAITYRIQVASHDNRALIFQNSAQSTFYAMEIAG